MIDDKKMQDRCKVWVNLQIIHNRPIDYSTTANFVIKQFSNHDYTFKKGTKWIYYIMGIAGKYYIYTTDYS